MLLQDFRARGLDKKYVGLYLVVGIHSQQDEKGCSGEQFKTKRLTKKMKAPKVLNMTLTRSKMNHKILKNDVITHETRMTLMRCKNVTT